jgi:peptide/nickel transport system substrate-binding protein
MKNYKFLFLLFAIGLLLTFTACKSEKTNGDETQVVVVEEKSDIDAPERVIRGLEVLTQPQAANPEEFETANIIVAAMRQLGLNVNLKVTPWEKMLELVWFDRGGEESFDMTGWQMTARPERLDPDEFTYNLFHSSTAADGYNFVGYNNPEYDAVAEKQRVTVDPKERLALIQKAQQIIADDAVYHFIANPTLNYVYNNKVFDSNSIVDMAGLGIKNFWTYISANPIGNQKDIILNSATTVQAINPLYISGSYDSWVTELLWDRLMRMGPDGLPELWAAESVKWKSDTEVEIKIRNGMTWHDGKPVTVEDVKYSFEVPMSGEVPMYKPFVDMIEDIHIVDNSTLIFTLNEPWSAFETASLAKMNLIPKHIWEPIIEDLMDKPENAESYQEEVPIGSGPYKFNDWKFSEEVVLGAYKDHFSTPKAERWILRVVSNMEAALGMIQNGDLNFLAVYLGDQVLLQDRVEQAADLTMVSSVDLGVKFFAVNQRRAPFDDVAFRRAIAAAIDRDLITQAVYKGHAVPADSMISPALEFWRNPNINYPSGGIQEARNILAEAGYQWDKDGKLLYPEGQKEELSSR